MRLTKVQPPEGWNAILWELAVVAVGVLIALAAQQWVDERSWSDKIEHLKGALNNEISDHYI